MPQLSLLPLSTSSPVIEAFPLAFNATVMFLHTAVGATVSKTHNLNVLVQVLLLLFASLTVNVTVVVPTPTTVPGDGLCVMVNNSIGVQLSVASTSVVIFGKTPCPLVSAKPDLADAQEIITGGTASVPVIVTGNVHSVPTSVEQVTRVVPTGKTDPDGGLQLQS